MTDHEAPSPRGIRQRDPLRPCLPAGRRFPRPGQKRFAARERYPFNPRQASGRPAPCPRWWIHARAPERLPPEVKPSAPPALLCDGALAWRDRRQPTVIGAVIPATLCASLRVGTTGLSLCRKRLSSRLRSPAISARPDDAEAIPCAPTSPWPAVSGWSPTSIDPKVMLYPRSAPITPRTCSYRLSCRFAMRRRLSLGLESSLSDARCRVPRLLEYPYTLRLGLNA